MFKTKQELLNYLQNTLKESERYSVSIESETDYFKNLEDLRDSIIKCYPQYKDKLMKLDLVDFEEVNDLYHQELEDRTENPYHEALLQFFEIFEISKDEQL